MFLPPLENADHAVELLAAIEAVAADLDCPVVIEGYSLPRDPRLQTLVVTPESPLTALPPLPDDVTGEIRPDGALAVTWRKSRIQAGAILAALHDAGVTITDVATEEPHLEEVFLAITEQQEQERAEAVARRFGQDGAAE